MLGAANWHELARTALLPSKRTSTSQFKFIFVFPTCPAKVAAFAIINAKEILDGQAARREKTLCEPRHAL